MFNVEALFALKIKIKTCEIRYDVLTTNIVHLINTTDRTTIKISSRGAANSNKTHETTSYKQEYR